MGWRDLLSDKEETLTVPWIGGREIVSGGQSWTVKGRLPREHGWHVFKLDRRGATWTGPSDDPCASDCLKHRVVGYLVGDRLIPDGTNGTPAAVMAASEVIRLLEPGLDRFARIRAGRMTDVGPLVYLGLEMGLGPEEGVTAAFLDRAASVADVPGVTPALEAAFRVETWQRAEAERRRAEEERRRREEEERRAQEERRRQLVEQFGNAEARRELAAIDFGEAARRALAVGGAEYLDHQRSRNRGEVVVQFRLIGRRFECTCDDKSLQIIDAGICLTDHDTGIRGDDWYTLETLPAVIRQGDREGKLVVFRHVGR